MFLLFGYIVEAVFRPFYFEEMEGLKQDTDRLKKIIKKRYKRFNRYLEQNDIFIENYMYSWMICLFSGLDIDDVLYRLIFEYIIVQKRKGIFQIILFIISRLEAKFIKNDDFDVKRAFKTVGRLFETKNIISAIQQIKVKEKYLTRHCLVSLTTDDQIIFKEQNLDLKSSLNKNYFKETRLESKMYRTNQNADLKLPYNKHTNTNNTENQNTQTSNYTKAY